jgi:thymidylate synthase (FAD)
MNKDNVKLVTYTADPIKNIELGARVSHDSSSRIGDIEKTNKFIKSLMNRNHVAVLEHSSATFNITGISRVVSHQLVRHRLASITQKSQRYVTERDFPYVIPKAIQDRPDLITGYCKLMDNIGEEYELLLNAGIKSEDARYVLPNATHTELTITANFREWLHIIDERVSKAAQLEIREVTILIWEQLYKIAPTVFGITYFNHSKDSSYKQEILDKF